MNSGAFNWGLVMLAMGFLGGGCVCERMPRWEYAWERAARAGKPRVDPSLAVYTEEYQLHRGRWVYIRVFWARPGPGIVVWAETECHRRGRRWVYTPGYWHSRGAVPAFHICDTPLKVRPSKATERYSRGVNDR